MSNTTKLIANRVLAILSGVIAGAITAGLIEMINQALFPAPEGMDYSNREALLSYMDGLPLTAYLVILLAHGIAALVGGFVASKIARVEKRGAALYTGLILLVAGILNIISIPHPIVFTILDLIIYVPAALLGNVIRKKIWP